jgi:threonine dehydratase
VAELTLADVQAARELIRDVAIETPMEQSRWLSALVDAPVWLKCENLQRCGSFKIRGAYVRISRLSPEERARGVVAASAGNHAQGVALAAQLLGIRSTVFMPEGAPIPKERATRAYGAHVVFEGSVLEESLAGARRFAEETGAVLIHPFDHVDIVAGQGTLGLEVLEQVPDVKTVLVPTGGGGLLAGVAIAVKALRPDVRVVGVQAEGAAAYPASLAEGCPVPLASMKTMADGIAVGLPGLITFAAVRDHVDEVRTVSEELLSRAVLAIVERAKQVVEPAGAAAVAALLDSPHDFATPVVAVLSGGNIDPLVLLHVTQHGLVAARRFLSLRIEIIDRPGSLAALLALVGQLGGNVVDVVHSRVGSSLPLGDVEVALRLETRGAAHCEEIVRALTAGGVRVLEQH